MKRAHASKEPAMNRVSTISSLLLAAILGARIGAVQHPSMPPGMTHEEHLAQMEKKAETKQRGAVVMGFDQNKTTHHFRLTVSGGFIQVEVNDSVDAVNRDLVRTHLKTIAEEFAAGNFAKPFGTHDEMPPGVKTMERKKSAISYQFEPTESGGRVRIGTKSADAVRAVHDFLRYQITGHATGDPLTVQ
jgi:hypothetical protein